MKPTIKTPGKPPGSRPPTGRSGAPVPAGRPANTMATQAFLQGVVSEMRRVTWPTREEWVTATLLTIGLVVVVGLYTAAADHIFGWVIGAITGQNTR
ncbi:MAG: hypothetical protein NVS2B17_18440 [Candidatus Velthaea sp.]